MADKPDKGRGNERLRARDPGGRRDPLPSVIWPRVAANAKRTRPEGRARVR
jgi:hypothetical protein